MRIFFMFLVLLCPLGSMASEVITDSTLPHETKELARPVTVLETVITRLDKEISEKADHITQQAIANGNMRYKPPKNKKAMYRVEGGASYHTKTGAVLGIIVHRTGEIEGQWRKVCGHHLTVGFSEYTTDFSTLDAQRLLGQIGHIDPTTIKPTARILDNNLVKLLLLMGDKVYQCLQTPDGKIAYFTKEEDVKRALNQLQF